MAIGYIMQSMEVNTIDDLTTYGVILFYQLILIRIIPMDIRVFTIHVRQAGEFLLRMCGQKH